MKKSLEKLSNRLHENDKHMLFGSGTIIHIDSVTYLTTKKCYHIIVSLEPTDADLTYQAYPHGVEYLVSEAWKFMGIPDRPIISVSILTQK